MRALAVRLANLSAGVSLRAIDLDQICAKDKMRPLTSCSPSQRFDQALLNLFNANTGPLLQEGQGIAS
jgi:hypothetical protein